MADDNIRRVSVPEHSPLLSVTFAALSPEWGDGLGRAAAFLLPLIAVPGALIAVILTILSTSRGERGTRLYRIALWSTVLGNLLLLIAGQWWFVMVESFDYGGPFVIVALVPISTAFVLSASLWRRRSHDGHLQ